MNTLTTRAKSISTCMPRPAPATTEPYTVPPDQYQGTELHPYNGRPGAMAAYALPSLFMGQLTYRDGRQEVLP